MRTIRQLTLAVVLTLTLGTSALAGIIECPPAPAPPPPDNQTGIIETPPQSESAPTDIEFALSIILQSVVTVF